MKDQSYYKQRLEDEKGKLEAELSQLAVQDPENPGHWTLRGADLDIMEADDNEKADRTEETHIDSIVLDELGARYRLVLHALAKFDAGTYGICEVRGQQIEEERLDANPAAKTCKAHLGAAEDKAL